MSATYGDMFGAGLYSSADLPENTKLTCWSFSIDGHPFVFVNLGTQGTLVYDFSTGQWSFWATEGDVGLGFQDGSPYDEFYLMGDKASNTIYTFDPNDQKDDDVDFTTYVTGGIPIRNRQTTKCNAVYLSGQQAEGTGGTVTLFTSDDDGASWVNHGDITVSANPQEIGWRSLGLMRAPGRIFLIRDEGVFSSIDTLTMSDNG